MIFHLFIGGFLIALTVAFQAITFDFLIKKVSWIENIDILKKGSLWKASVITIIVLAVTSVLFTQMWFWALFYLLVNALPDLRTALYFSIETFTTVGFGDVLPTDEWRLLASIESANGFIMFGWSTAFIFEIVSRLYKKESRAI